MNAELIPREAERTVVCISPNSGESSFAPLQTAGWQVMHARTGSQAERLIDRHPIKAGLIELRLGCTEAQLSALDACMRRTEVTWVARVWPGQAEEALTRRFILDYCFDYVTMPCPQEDLAFALAHAHGISILREAAAAPRAGAKRHQMIGQCEAMLKLYNGIDKCARTDAPVFIAGESGTGKELTARAIHNRSPRARKAYVAVNCAAIPAALLQSELFGYERGAFTGAQQQKIGRIESAMGGTLFLDEIGDMPYDCQAVLLRFLQEGTIERLGGNGAVKVDVRIVSATHVDLEAAVSAGRFRADLYHRLCVLRLCEPPLRERGDDIKLLAEHALATHRQDGRRKIRGFSDAAVAAMLENDWPGNVRELFNCVRRAVVMAEGRLIDTVDLGLHVAPKGRGTKLAGSLSESDRRVIQQVLSKHVVSLSRDAAELGVSLEMLYKLIGDQTGQAGVRLDALEKPALEVAGTWAE